MQKNFKIENPSPAVAALTITIFVAVLAGLGLFAWWAFSWSTHTLVWLVFIFGSILGSVRSRGTK